MNWRGRIHAGLDAFSGCIHLLNTCKYCDDTWKYWAGEYTLEFHFMSFLEDFILSFNRNHCILHGLNDREKAFRTECKIPHNDQDCFHCQNIHSIIDGYEGVLQDCKSEMDKVDQCLYEQCLYKIRTSYENITKYYAHAIQSACQSMKFDDVMTYDGKTAVAIADFRLVPIHAQYVYHWWFCFC